MKDFVIETKFLSYKDFYRKWNSGVVEIFLAKFYNSETLASDKHIIKLPFQLYSRNYSVCVEYEGSVPLSTVVCEKYVDRFEVVFSEHTAGHSSYHIIGRWK